MHTFIEVSPFRKVQYRASKIKEPEIISNILSSNYPTEEFKIYTSDEQTLLYEKKLKSLKK